MAPKRRKQATLTMTGRSSARVPETPPMILLKDTLDDLRYIEPARARDRVVSCLNELFLRVHNLEHMHEPEHEKK